MGVVNPALAKYRSQPQATPTSSPYIDLLAQAVSGLSSPTSTNGTFQDPNTIGIKPNPPKHEPQTNSSNRDLNTNSVKSPTDVRTLTPRAVEARVLSSEKPGATNQKLVQNTPAHRGVQSAPSKLHMAQSANQRPDAELKQRVENTPKLNQCVKSESVVVKSPLVEGGADELSANELRKLRQAQRKEEWQKKHALQKTPSEDGVKDESDGYDLEELVSEGMFIILIDNYLDLLLILEGQ